MVAVRCALRSEMWRSGPLLAYAAASLGVNYAEVGMGLEALRRLSEYLGALLRGSRDPAQMLKLWL